MKASLRLIFACLFIVSSPANADLIRIAVASNFEPTLQKIIRILEAKSNNQFLVSAGSTSTLYAQISAGAPFDIFLAADSKHPALLVSQGLATKDNRKSYAIGKLALWIPRNSGVVDATTLQQLDGPLAIANPAFAPYGIAAQAFLHKINSDSLPLVKGNNVAQAFHFVKTGNVRAGLVAASQVLTDHIPGNQYWLVDQNLYPILEQQIVILHDNMASQQFSAFMFSDEAQQLIVADGYGIPAGIHPDE